MCGIVYQHNLDKTPVNNDIMQQFDKQRSRGVQGFGLYDGSHGHLVRASQEKGILKWLVKYNSNLVLFHHRNPTSTINVKRAAHPFSTKDYFGKTQYILVHNGHISNARSLYEKHKELGIKYQSVLQDGTFNDSESLLWDMALTLEGKQSGLHAQGGIAFIALKLHKGKLTNMFFGRNSNPLNLLRTKTTVALSSEGAGDPIEPDTLYAYNYSLNRLTNRHFEIPRYSYAVNTPTVSKADWDTDEEWWADYYKSKDKHAQPACYDYDDEREELMKVDFEEEEIQEGVALYLEEAKGDWERAYWIAEHDYEAIFEDQNYDMTDALMMEKVIQAIINDPGYTKQMLAEIF